MKVGEVVQLRSGGPLMTVQETNPIQAIVVWFEGNSLRSEVFPISALKVMPQGGNKP